LKPIVKDENLQEKDNFQTIKVNGLEDLIDGRKALSALLAWEKVQINFNLGMNTCGSISILQRMIFQ
jgi:hypothetical protein